MQHNTRWMSFGAGVLATMALLVGIVAAVSTGSGAAVAPPDTRGSGPTPTPTRTPTPVNVGNRIWEDLDADGIQDPGEPGLADVVVELWDANQQNLVDETVSSATGSYTAVAPRPGTYYLRALLPGPGDTYTVYSAGADGALDSDVRVTGPIAGWAEVSLGSNLISTTVYDIGIVRGSAGAPVPGAIGNLVWNDVNGDGRQDAGEPGIGGVTVHLWDAGLDNVLFTDTSNDAGFYTLAAPDYGRYRVQVVLPAKTYAFTLPNQGADNATDSDVLTAGLEVGFTQSVVLFAGSTETDIVDAGLVVGVQPIATPTPTLVTPQPTPTPTLTPTSGPGVRCAGRLATVVGTAGADELVGTPGNDVIVARGGRDTIAGRGGRDVICGGRGNDTIGGGRGRDLLVGQRGDDALNGGRGRPDRCRGGPGTDTASGCERRAGVP